MKSTTVLVDGLVFENTFQIGIWRVFYEVMSRTTKDVRYVLLLNKEAVQPIPPNIETLKLNLPRTTRRRSRIIQQLRSRSSFHYLNRHFPDAIWHSTFYTTDPRAVKRSVVSVYDMISERFFSWTPGLRAQILKKSAAVAEAEAVLTISESTADQLRRFFPSLQSPVYTALLGADHLITCASRQDNSQPEAFCLFVGARNAYKNFHFLIETACHPKWPKGLTIRVTGSEFSEDERRLMRYFGVEDSFQSLGHVSDKQLAELYETAHLFIFPSLAEGFGLPTLESQMNGCLSAISDIPVFREIAGDGALYFDPRSPNSLALVVAESFDPHLRKDTIAKGRANATEFTWDVTAAATLRCYEELRN